MARTPRDVPDAELAVLEALWKNGPMTMRGLAKFLYEDESPSASATVQKLLTRLTRKEMVRRNADVSPILFTATIDRTGLIDRRLRETAESLCEGSLTPLLTQLVQSTDFSKDDRDRMLALIDKLAAKNEPESSPSDEEDNA